MFDLLQVAPEIITQDDAVSLFLETQADIQGAEEARTDVEGSGESGRRESRTGR